MAKYHIGKNGPGVCNAKYKCRFGGESGKENHFGTQKEAMAAWAEQEGLTEVPKNTLRANQKKDMERIYKRRKNSTRFNNFHEIASKNLTKELKNNKELNAIQKAELKRMTDEFKGLENKNQVNNFIKNLSEENNKNSDFAKARKTFRTVVSDSLKEEKAAPKTIEENIKNIKDEFNKINSGKSSSNSKEYKEAMDEAHEMIRHTNNEGDIHGHVHELENLMIEAKYNNEPDKIKAYSDARKVFVEKSNVNVDDVLSRDIIGEQLSTEKTTKFLSTGKEYDKVSKKVYSDISSVKDSKELDKLVSGYWKELDNNKTLRDNSNDDSEIDKYDQMVNAYEDFIPNLEKASADLARREELESALKTTK